MKPGRWWSEQTEVKAPGTAKSTTFLPWNSSSVQTFWNRPSFTVCSFTLGTLSPTRIVMSVSPSGASYLLRMGLLRMSQRGRFPLLVRQRPGRAAREEQRHAQADHGERREGDEDGLEPMEQSRGEVVQGLGRQP